MYVGLLYKLKVCINLLNPAFHFNWQICMAGEHWCLCDRKKGKVYKGVRKIKICRDKWRRYYTQYARGE